MRDKMEKNNFLKFYLYYAVIVGLLLAFLFSLSQLSHLNTYFYSLFKIVIILSVFPIYIYYFTSIYFLFNYRKNKDKRLFVIPIIELITSSITLFAIPFFFDNDYLKKIFLYVDVFRGFFYITFSYYLLEQYKKGIKHLTSRKLITILIFLTLGYMLGKITFRYFM